VRTIAVDWSGRALNAGKTIWVAEVAGGELVFLENGRGRADVARMLIELAAITPDMVVGLDFAFSFPAWFPAQEGWVTARDVWDAACLQGEGWLTACEPPFWGHPGKRRPDVGAYAQFRVTDLAVPSTGRIRPKSIFQIGGAGAVGTGSVRGMVTLSQLSRAGFSVWPFDPPGRPLVIEIYPRVLTGRVRKSALRDREAFIASIGLSGSRDLIIRAACTEDSFDAAVSAWVMSMHEADLSDLPQSSDRSSRLEGLIWNPTAPDAIARVVPE
jgi:hypothetical protein